jgi:hypothetical protein
MTPEQIAAGLEIQAKIDAANAVNDKIKQRFSAPVSYFVIQEGAEVVNMTTGEGMLEETAPSEEIFPSSFAMSDALDFIKAFPSGTAFADILAAVRVAISDRIAALDAELAAL